MNLPPRAYGPSSSLQRQGSGFGLFLLLLFSSLYSPAVAQCPDEIEVLQPISCSGADDGVLTVALPDGVDGADVYWLIEGDTLFGAVQSGLGPGSYLAFVPGCSALGATLNEPFPFFISAAVLQLPTCDAPCSGEVSVTPNFGVEPITYSWSHDAVETGPVGTGICEQVVVVSATDGNGCSDQDITVVEIPPVEVMAFGTDPTCNGFDDGSVSAVATGGLGGAFAFSWTDGQGNPIGNGADLTGLLAGAYTVTATDTGGCALYTTVTLNDPPPVDVETGSLPVSCNGDADGTVWAVFAGAVLYEWTGPGGFSTIGAALDTLTGLAPGTYAVEVTASDGCLGMGVATVEEPDVLSAESFLSAPTCPGLSDGTVGVVPVGGTAPYTVIWTLPDGGSATGEFLNGQSAGLYAYDVTDAAGCTASGSVELTEPEAITVDFDITPPPCAVGVGADAGAITAIVTGGLAPHSATWLDLESLAFIGTGLTQTGLTTGLYGVSIADQLGCTLDTLVLLDGPDSLTISVLATMPSCFGDEDGTALAVVEGGAPAVSVVWTGDVAPTIGLFMTGLGTGEYTATATDANGCMAETAFILQEPESLVFEVETTPVGCDGADGALSSTVAGGIPEYTVLWTGPEGELGNGLELSGLEVGAYEGNLTDANGCMVSWSGDLLSLPPVEVSAVVTVVDCETGSAALAVSATGGEDPLDLTLEGPSGTVSESDWTSLPPGAYTLSASDARGCTADTAWTVNPALIVETSSLPEGCTGPGEIAVTTSGGTGSYDFNTDPVGAPTTSDDSSAVWSGLTAGVYTVSVSDGVCSVDTEIDLAGFTVFDWTVTSFDYACEFAPGVISVLVSGGAEPLVIAGASSDGSLTWAAADTVGLPAGDYTLTVTDAAGCLRDTTIIIDALPPLTLSAIGSSISCHGAEDGTIEVMASGGSEPLVLGAEGPSGLLLEPFESLSAGTYIVGVVDARGCLADTTLTLVEPDPITVVATATPESCEGTADGTAVIDADGGTAPLTIQWDGGPQDSLWTGLAAGSYAWTVVDAQGCDTSGTVTVEPGGGLDVLVDVEIEACEGAEALASIHLSVTGNVDSATVLLGGLPADEVTSSGTSGVWTWTGLPSGVYGWTASLGPDCATSGVAEVDLPAPLSWSGLVEQPVCSGDSGVVVASSEGGSLPVAWAWSGVSVAGDTLVGTGADSGALPAGQYDFVVTDSLGCSLLEPITIEAESNGLAVEVSLTQPSCGGALVGEATVSPTGGLPPYDITVEGAADSLFLPFLVPGTYPFTLTDSVGCTVGDTITIDPASDFELIADVDSATCFNSEDGLILLETLNGVGEAEFTFVGPFGAVPTTDSIPDLMAGVYEITALDEAGCPAVLLVSVGAPPPIVVLLDSLDRPSCAGDLDGALSVTTEGGAGTGFDIQWTVDALPAGQGPQLNGIGEGVYAVVVTDSAGCTGDIASIPLVAEGDVTLTVPADTSLCAGLPLQLEAMAEGATELGWSLPGGETGVGLVAAVAELTAGEGHWIFTASRLGCVRTDSVTVTGWALPTPDAGPDQIVPEGGTASIGGAGNPEWEHAWEPALDVVSPEAAATATEALFSATEFILTATTLDGCAASDTVFVDVLLELDIPSGFTPNADGINDAWNLGGLDQYPSAEITLFNRWGAVLLTYGSTDGSWDGNLNGIPVPVGTYYYHIRVNEPALQAEWTGPITLMR